MSNPTHPTSNTPLPTAEMPHSPESALSKVPQVTLLFWIIKIIATTLGETGGDAVSMSMGFGYLIGTGIFLAALIICVALQIKSPRFQPWLYWSTILASTMLGTTLADYADRSLGIGYLGGSTLLFALLATSLCIWHRTLGTISVASVRTPAAEIFYWLTITCSQTLGTALGDWTADSASMGYLGGAVLFLSLLAIVVILYKTTRISHTILFWCAFVLTRPLGAVVGDLLDKPLAQGGLGIDRYLASGILLVFVILCLIFFPQRAAKEAH